MPPVGYLDSMRRSFVLLLVTLAGSANAQQKPLKSAWMAWPDLKVVVTPDSGQTLLWLTADSAMTRESGGRVFYGSFTPAEALAWVRSSRAFLRQSLADRDTGDTRTSPVLRARHGQQIYFLRRRFNGKWTHERFLVFADSAGRAPGLIEADVRFRDVLDSLEVVARRSPRTPQT